MNSFKLYYKGARVESVNRTYVYQRKLKAEIEVQGKTLIVNRAELLEEGELDALMDVETLKEPTTPVKKEAEAETVVLATVEEVVIPPQPVEIEEEVPNMFEAIRLSNNRKTKIEGQDGLETFVKKNKLDMTTVQRVLDGKQKTHKGFGFKVI